jgi:flagellin
MSVVFNAATAANVNILRETNQLFQTAQKRVATGKSIFGAADEATRYTMSQTMLSRSRNIDSVNSNISTALKTLESTDKTLTQINKLLSQMNDMATAALNAGSSPTVAANPTANISDATPLTGVSTGHRLSITSDSGKNFTYTFSGTSGATNWGQVAQALNNANIGVTMRFEANGTGSAVVLEATDKATGFTLDGGTSQAVASLLTGINSGYDGGYVASRFAPSTNTPAGFGGTVPYGLRFGTGGVVTTASTFAGSSVGAGTSLTFLGSDGVARTWSTTATKNIDSVLAEINAMNAGVKAEFVTTGVAGSYRVSLRNLSGNTMTILNGTGDFDSNTGADRFNAAAGLPVVQGNPVLGSTNNSIRLQNGQNFESYKTEITSLINQNVTQAGRNLLLGQNVSIILNEFSANAITVSGVNTSVAGNLGLTTNGTTWSTNGNISSSQSQVQAAMQLVNSLQSQFGTYASFVKARYDINQTFSSDLKSLGDDLVATDIAEESAKMTALQTQQQFAVQAFSAGSQNAQNLLRLLG